MEIEQSGSLSPEQKLLLAERLQNARQAIAEAARSAGRQPEEITLIGVSKFFPPWVAQAAAEIGLADLGENRVQEMLEKIKWLENLQLLPNWHLIGTLQKNKVRQVIGRTHLIHSADSLPLLEEISQRSIAANLVTDLLLQVNTAGEETKHGFTPQEIRAAAEYAMQAAGIRLRGLMTMAPLFANADDSLPVFDQTFELFCKTARDAGNPASFDVLSMGMSLDFRQAIACGSTHVRLGTAIFGPRL